MRKMIFAAAALSLGVTPALAQGVQGGLVNVQVPVTVLNGSLNNNQIEILKNVGVDVAAPISVQVPVGIAANVCGIAANVLAADLKQDGKADCTASNASSALGQQILKQKARGK